VVDQKQATLDFREIGFVLLEDVVLVKSKVNSECLKCGQEIQQSYLQVKNRIKRNTGLVGCRDCFKRRDESEVIKVLHGAGLEPLAPYPGAGVPWKFKCKSCGENSSRRLADIQVGKGCPVCGKRNRKDPRWVLENEAIKNLKSVNLKPLEPYPGNARVGWRAKCLTCNNEVSPNLSDIRAGQGGCKYCASKSSGNKRRRSEIEVKAELAKHKLLLVSKYENSRKSFEVKCQKCKRNFSIIYKTAEKGLGCPYCSNKRVDPIEAVKIMKKYGLEPLEPYPGSPHKKWRCRCKKCKIEVTPQFSYARHGRGICPHCAGTVVDVGKAIELMNIRGLEPLVDFPGSAKPWLCKCVNCGNKTSPRFNAIYSKTIGGCKWCAEKGFDYSAPSIVYLITHSEYAAHKIGIAANTSQRMKAHKREGWITYKTLNIDNGYLAKQIEDEILAWWRFELGLAHFVPPDLMPQGGFSETVSADEVGLMETWEYVLKSLRKIKTKNL
jgi:Zn finger protein HypA/HybF involved in hydrogenase expression